MDGTGRSGGAEPGGGKSQGVWNAIRQALRRLQPPGNRAPAADADPREGEGIPGDRGHQYPPNAV